MFVLNCVELYLCCSLKISPSNVGCAFEKVVMVAAMNASIKKVPKLKGRVSIFKVK